MNDEATGVRQFLWFLLFMGIMSICGLALFQFFHGDDLEKGEPPLQVLGQVSEFSLTDQDGQPFGSKELKDKVWVADFVFVQCSGPCPVMTRGFADVQKKFQGVPNYRFVTFSCDPKNDSPEALKEYAKRFDADESKWKFLTGSEAVISRVCSELKCRMEKPEKVEKGGHQINHSVLYVLVDRQGRVRGVYEGATWGEETGWKANTLSQELLDKDIRRLLRE